MSDSTTFETPPPQFVVLQHGINGRPSDLSYLRGLLENSGRGCTTVFDTDVNARVGSHRGIERCAQLLFEKVRPALDRFIATHTAGSSTNPTCQKLRFSCVGHSFGGILVRRLVCLVYSVERYRSALEFSCFVTVAAPHLGARSSHGTRPISTVARVLGPYLWGTLHELCLGDGPDGVLPSLLVDQAHLDALAAFRTRLLVGNVTNDHLVPFQSAALLLGCEYEELVEMQRQVPRADRPTPSTLPMVHLPKVAPEAAARAAGQRHAGTEEARIVGALRGAAAFDVLPVVTDNWYVMAHPACVSKTKLWQRARFDDVSSVISDYIISEGAQHTLGGPRHDRAVVVSPLEVPQTVPPSKEASS